MSQNERSTAGAHWPGEHDEGLVDGGATDCSLSALAPPPGTAEQHGGASRGHGAAVVATESELLAVALPYLDEGLRAGDLVVLYGPHEAIDRAFALLEPARERSRDDGLA